MLAYKSFTTFQKFKLVFFIKKEGHVLVVNYIQNRGDFVKALSGWNCTEMQVYEEVSALLYVLRWVQFA